MADWASIAIVYYIKCAEPRPRTAREIAEGLHKRSDVVRRELAKLRKLGVVEQWRRGEPYEVNAGKLEQWLEGRE